MLASRTAVFGVKRFLRVIPQLYDSFPMIRSLPLPFAKAFKNVEVCTQCIYYISSYEQKQL